ncbi:Sphingosine kinase 1 [Bagarius yarrelli]|uniref:sphingosine kinase n=1 Tax=Bagarius yarrelli TaxID=175774 RepID=A0A556V7A8_BAGYA|nr:Sphingosine kinase 1 [Bagarius yarrelli]
MEADAELRAEFTDAASGRLRLSVTLTDSCLTVRKIGSGSPVWQHGQEHDLELGLGDCVGCRASQCEDEGDTAAFLSVYFYPARRSWTRAPAGRQRVEHRFRVAAEEDARANLEEAETWARAVRHRASQLVQGLRNDCLMKILIRSATGENDYILLIIHHHDLLDISWCTERKLNACVEFSRVCVSRSVMVLVNPQSGRGQAMSLYTGPVLSMLTEANISHTLITTEHRNHARELVRNADLSQWSAIVILSGDGLLFEVINGLMEREDWDEAIRIPLGILPGGSGNALAASVHHYTQAGPALGEDLLLSCCFLLCKGLVCPLDIVSVRLSSGPRLFSFLSLAWGFVADVDIESEKFRHVGAMRFLVGTLLRLASLRTYQGRLAFLPARENSTSSSVSFLRPHTSFCDSVQRVSHMQQETSNRHECEGQNTHNNSNDKDFQLKNDSKDNRLPDNLLSPIEDPVPTNWTIEKEQEFVLVLATCHSHLAEELVVSPDARPDDGHLHLLYVTAGISRPALLRLFLAMEKGTHLSCECPHLIYRRVQALRLEPITKPGVITVDGEQVEYGPIQAQVHKGYARIICG